LAAVRRRSAAAPTATQVTTCPEPISASRGLPIPNLGRRRAGCDSIVGHRVRQRPSQLRWTATFRALSSLDTPRCVCVCAMANFVCFCLPSNIGFLLFPFLFREGSRLEWGRPSSSHRRPRPRAQSTRGPESTATSTLVAGGTGGTVLSIASLAPSFFFYSCLSTSTIRHLLGAPSTKGNYASASHIHTHMSCQAGDHRRPTDTLGLASMTSQKTMHQKIGVCAVAELQQPEAETGVRWPTNQAKSQEPHLGDPPLTAWLFSPKQTGLRASPVLCHSTPGSSNQALGKRRGGSMSAEAKYRPHNGSGLGTALR
ncbi:hypothetical protein QBC47DRAFT_437154, partial [Echria macrotheca]